MRPNNTRYEDQIEGPFLGHFFSHVSQEVLDQPYDSVSWTLDIEFKVHLVILRIWGPLIWVRELCSSRNNPLRPVRLGLAYVRGWGVNGFPPFLGFGIGTIVESFCIGVPQIGFSLYSWQPLVPPSWAGGHLHLRVHWLSARLDM